jgi:peptide deformylase
MSLPIVHYNEPVLRRKGETITAFDDALRALGNAMVETMHEARGIGLAAQQVGKALRLCVIDLRDTDRDFDWAIDGTHPPLDLIMPMMIANPTVKPAPRAPLDLAEEGCLSFPGIRGDVERPDTITVSYQDEHGTPHTLKCNGLFARCVQHEVDHLNGVLFIDRMAKTARATIDEAVKALAKETRASAR